MWVKPSLFLISLFYGTFTLCQESIKREFKAFSECRNQEEDCEELYSAALVKCDALQDDSLAAYAYIKLAQIRKDVGFWDEEVERLLVLSKAKFQKAGSLCGEAGAMRELANYHKTSEKDGIGLRSCLEALELSRACGDPELVAISLATLGVAYQQTGEFEKALEAHREELDIYQELENVEMQAVSKQEMAYIYASMNDIPRANKIMLESAELFKDMELDIRYANCITDLCANYLDQNYPDSVIYFLPSVIEIYRRENFALGLAIATYNLGEAYLILENYTNAMALYNESELVCADIDFPRFLMEIELSKSLCYSKMGNHEKAWEFIKKAEVLAQETANFEGLLNIYSYKMDAAYEVGEYEESKAAAKEYIQLKDSLRSIARDEKVAAMQEEFEAEQREYEIELLESQAQLDDQKQTGLVIIAILILISSTVVLNREVKRRKKARQLHLTEIELREAKEAGLKEELEFKKRELASKALQIAQQNEVMESLREDVKNITVNAEADQSVNEVLNTLKIQRSIEGNWEEFTRQFQEINPDFYRRLSEKAEGITKNDMRLAALLRMNLSSKEIASILNITMEGVKKARQRFRKKLAITSEQSLEKFVFEL